MTPERVYEIAIEEGVDEVTARAYEEYQRIEPFAGREMALRMAFRVLEAIGYRPLDTPSKS